MPNRILCVKSTAFPNGQVISYAIGMPQLTVRSLTKEMKQAIIEAVSVEHIRIRLLLNLNQFRNGTK